MTGHGGCSKNNRSAFTMGSSLKILAVDDEPSIVQSMFFIFEEPMYELDSAEDGEAALARVAANPNPFDVVITDNNMPGVSGIELVRQLRERNFPGKIMVLSAHLSVDVRAAYEEMKVDAMIEKPFSVKALRHALDELAA
jgi:two-component system, OmpR family, alkaline phosphatase synthesis response regulator PhoP